MFCLELFPQRRLKRTGSDARRIGNDRGLDVGFRGTGHGTEMLRERPMRCA